MAANSAKPKHKLYFRKPVLGAKKLKLEHEYFDIAVNVNQYYIPDTFRDKLEYSLFRFVSDVWNSRKRNRWYYPNIDLPVRKEQKERLRETLIYIRKSWQAMNEGNELLAKYELKCAECHWHKFCSSKILDFAMIYFEKCNKASLDGYYSVKKRWVNTKTSTAQRDKNIKAAIADGNKIAEIAREYGLTTRRVHQIKKSKNK